MPNIQQYGAGSGEIRPSDAGTQAAVQTGRAIAGAWNSVGGEIASTAGELGQEVEKHQSFQEISHGMAVGATVADGLQRSLDDALKNGDPNDPNVVNDWLNNTMGPKLAELQDAPQTDAGKQWALNYTKSLQQSLVEKARGTQASMAGQAAVANYTHALNQSQTAVYNDPMSLDTQIGMMRMNVDALTAHMAPEAAAALKENFDTEGAKDITVAGMRAKMDANPAQGLADLAKGGGAVDQYLNDDDKSSLTRYGAAVQRGQDEQAKADAEAQKQAAKQQYNQAASLVSASLVDPNDPSGVSIPQNFYSNIITLAQMPGADAGEIRALADMGRSITKDKAEGTKPVTDPQTYSDFSKRMFLDASDPHALSFQEVFKARADGLLNDKDMTFFKEAVTNNSDETKQDPEAKDFHSFVASMKGYITKSSLMSIDQYGDQRYYEFQSDAAKAYAYAKAKGVPLDGIKQLVRNSIPKYQTSQAQNIDALSQQTLKPLEPASGKAVSPRNPGESAADYLKRTGG